VVVPYRPGLGGSLLPEIPAEGPCRDRSGACDVRPHDWRDRCTGPCFPLRVVRCHVHGRSFTLYPPGHVPYGREPVAPVSPDGESTGKGPDRFAGTVFGAALDAARGVAWSRESSGSDDPGWPTMWRRLSAAAAWLGVAPRLSDREREERATDLDVDLLPLLEASAALRAAPGYRSRGAAVVTVLGELAAGRPLLSRLLRAGHGAGLLGEPLVPVRPGGPLRSLARERRPRAGPSPGRDPPRNRDVPSPRRGP